MFHFIFVVLLFSSVSCQSNPASVENNAPPTLQNFRELLPANMLPEFETLPPSDGLLRGSLRQATENIQRVIPDGRLSASSAPLPGENFGGIGSSPINQLSFGSHTLPQGPEFSSTFRNFQNFQPGGQNQQARGAPILMALNQNVLPSTLRNNFDLQQMENFHAQRGINPQFFPLGPRQENQRFDLRFAENSFRRPPFPMSWQNNIPRDLSFLPIFHGPVSGRPTTHQRIQFNRSHLQQRKKKQKKTTSTKKSVTPTPETTTHISTTTKKYQYYIPNYYARDRLKKDNNKYRNSKNTQYDKGYTGLTKSSDKYESPRNSHPKKYDTDGKEEYSKYRRPGDRKRQNSRQLNYKKSRQNKLSRKQSQRNQKRNQRRKNSSSSDESSDEKSGSGSSEDRSRKSKRGGKRGKKPRKGDRDSSSDD